MQVSTLFSCSDQSFVRKHSILRWVSWAIHMKILVTPNPGASSAAQTFINQTQWGTILWSNGEDLP